ncbi:MAG: putative metallopeptidase [Gammaproteobacteria bacterium]
MTTYWRAKDVEALVEKLVPEYHEHLDRADVTIRCVFRDTISKSRGRMRLGVARKISGLNAHLVGLVRRDDLDGDPADFFVVEVPHEPWYALTEAQRLALVDHELCHFYVAIPEDPDKPRQLVILGHDLEEFCAVVERHGLWRPDLTEFARVLKGRGGDQPDLFAQKVRDELTAAGIDLDGGDSDG